MTATRRLLLAVLLVCAQLFAQGVLAGHSIEHGLENGQLPAHGCSLCITAQHLGCAATSGLATLGASTAAFIPPPEPLFSVGETRLLRANQRAPPVF